MTLHRREGLAIGIEWSNQEWQVDHTRTDVMVVGQSGEVLGRPWLTIVVDTYSRCIMGMHLGFDAPGGIVERPFGTFNTQFFSSLPSYVSSNVETRSPILQREACLMLMQLEQLLEEGSAVCAGDGL